MDVFKHANISRWRHCNADSLKTLKANYIIRLLFVYRMTKLNMSVKFCFEIPSDCWENCKTNIKGLLFCRTLYIENATITKPWRM